VVDIVRAPLIGRVPEAASYAVVVVLAIGGWLLTYAVFKRFRKRIAYWS
jgi:ABC-type polysaccharide/polyol phosphate export permease